MCGDRSLRAGGRIDFSLGDDEGDVGVQAYVRPRPSCVADSPSINGGISWLEDPTVLRWKGTGSVKRKYTGVVSGRKTGRKTQFVNRTRTHTTTQM